MGWYRFTGKAGTHMATECVPMKHCGTEATGWIKGPRPSKEDGAVDRTVCFHWGGECCFGTTTVKVRNCGGFYLFYLRRNPVGVYKNFRYCGNNEGNVEANVSEQEGSRF